MTRNPHQPPATGIGRTNAHALADIAGFTSSRQQPLGALVDA